jgi:NitT/TauT family transport system permease protein
MRAGLGERPRAERLGWSLAGALLLLGAWALAAGHQPEVVLPSPGRTAQAVIGLAQDGVLADSLLTTLQRAGIGVGIALIAGGLWGAAAGRYELVAAMTQPGLSALMALPPVVIVVLALIWLGTGGRVAIFVVALVALPLIVASVREAIRNIDRDLIEVVDVFAVPRGRMVRHLIVPGIASPVLATTSVAVGQSLRVAVMAELLAAGSGVGFEVARARTNIETADVFAWAAVLVASVLVVEFIVLQPLTRRALRWRHDTTRPPGT